MQHSSLIDITNEFEPEENYHLAMVSKLLLARFFPSLTDKLHTKLIREGLKCLSCSYANLTSMWPAD